MLNNTVPLGEAGTGAAYILPQESQAANGLLETIAYNQKVAQANDKAKQAQAQALAKSYKENTFKAKNGTLWNNELMALQQKHLEQGSKYAQQGIDIYNPNPNDPEQMAAHDQYMSDRAKLYDMQDVRDQLQKHLLEQDKKVSESTPGKFDPDSINTLHSFYTGNKLKDIVDKGLQAPYVQEAFDPEKEVLSKVEPVMTGEREFVQGSHKITTNAFMPKATGRLVEQMYQSSPGGLNHIMKQTGLTPQAAKQIPDNLQDITDLNDHNFRYTLEGRQAVAQAGITSYSDPKYQQLLQQKSQSDLLSKQKYNAIIQEGVDRGRAKAKIVNKNVPDFALENQGYRRNEEARAAANFNKKQQNEFAAPVYNVNDNVAVEKAGTTYGGKKGATPNIKTSTSPLSFDVGAIKGDLTPTRVYNTDNGEFSPSTGSIRVTGNQLKLKPVLNYTDAKGRGFSRILSDDEVNNIKDGNQVFNSGSSKITPSSKDISYQYMLYGQQPAGKGHYKNVAIPWDESVAKSVDKKVNFDEAENKLPVDIQAKVLYDRLKHQYPTATDDDIANGIHQIILQRQQKFNSNQ